MWAWKTATHAFAKSGSSSNYFYKSGDQILFKRGQIFNITSGVIISPNKAGYGYLFGAYGSGAKPKLQYTGSGVSSIINQAGNAAHITFQDLEINCQNAQLQRCRFHETSGGSHQNDISGLLFLRMDINKSSNASLLQGKINGVFIVDSNFYNSTGHLIYTQEARRVAFLRNNFDFSGNHISYLNGIHIGVIAENKFSRAPIGRTAMRLSHDTQHMYVARNSYEGWYSPIFNENGNIVCKLGQEHSSVCPDFNEWKQAGALVSAAYHNNQEYSWNIVHIAPNTNVDGIPQEIKDIIFEHNIITNSQTLLNVGSAEDVIVRNNIMTSKDPNGPRIVVGSKHGFDLKPSKNIYIIGNTILSQNNSSILEVRKYTGPSYNGLSKHENIVFNNNILYSENNANMLEFEGNLNDYPDLSIDYNLYYSKNNFESQIRFGENGVLNQTLTQWRNSTGFDQNSIYADPQFIRVLGEGGIFSPNSYSSDLRLQSTSPARGSGIKMPALLYLDFNNKVRPYNVEDIGAFSH